MIVAFAEVFGILFLWIPCMLNAWSCAIVPSTKPWPAGIAHQSPSRPYVDTWTWAWLRPWFANNEDGVSGQQAYIWVNGHPVNYASTWPHWVPKWVIAYQWSAWRNGAHAAKLAAGVDTPPTDP